jgi:hypothetical protein
MKYFDTHLFNSKLNYSQTKQIFENCDVSSCDLFDKTKAYFPPNYIFKSFIYLTLDDMAVTSQK